MIEEQAIFPQLSMRGKYLVSSTFRTSLKVQCMSLIPFINRSTYGLRNCKTVKVSHTNDYFENRSQATRQSRSKAQFLTYVVSISERN